MFFLGSVQSAIWAMYAVMKLDARGAAALNELTTVLLSGTFSWRPLVPLSPEAELWIMHVRAQALSGRRHINCSCYLSRHILWKSQVNMSPAGLRYAPRKTTTDIFCSRKQRRRTKAIAAFKELVDENVMCTYSMVNGSSGLVCFPNLF